MQESPSEIGRCCGSVGYAGPAINLVQERRGAQFLAAIAVAAPRLLQFSVTGCGRNCPQEEPLQILRFAQAVALSFGNFCKTDMSFPGLTQSKVPVWLCCHSSSRKTHRGTHMNVIILERKMLVDLAGRIQKQP